MGEIVLHQAVETIAERFGVRRALFSVVPRYNIVPGDYVAAVTHDASRSERQLRGFKWGLVPFWAGEEEQGHRLAGARAETLAQKPSFKFILSRQRCLIPASGFFERHKDGAQTTRLYARPRGDEMWAFAGLWDEWRAPSGFVLRTCTIITTAPNYLLAPLHHRMPAILRPGDEARWLDPKVRDEEQLLPLLQPYPARHMEIYPVAQHIKWMKADDPRRIERHQNASLRLPWLDEAAERAKLPRAFPGRRVVRREGVSPDGQVFFSTKSWTRDDYTRWHPVVDTFEGHVFCDCPDFRFRHARHEPDVMTPQHWCKHLARAIENCRRKGELGLVR